MGERLPFPQVDEDQESLLPGFSFRQPDLIEAR
jgi:hypothetical protein